MAQEPKSLNISMSPLTSELIPLNIDVDLYLQNNSLFSPFSAHLSLPYPGVGIFCTVTISHNGLPRVVFFFFFPRVVFTQVFSILMLHWTLKIHTWAGLATAEDSSV